jgi:hypothetical protein
MTEKMQASNYVGPGSIPGQVVWNSRLAKWHWGEVYQMRHIP